MVEKLSLDLLIDNLSQLLAKALIKYYCTDEQLTGVNQHADVAKVLFRQGPVNAHS